MSRDLFGQSAEEQLELPLEAEVTARSRQNNQPVQPYSQGGGDVCSFG